MLADDFERDFQKCLPSARTVAERISFFAQRLGERSLHDAFSFLQLSLCGTFARVLNRCTEKGYQVLRQMARGDGRRNGVTRRRRRARALLAARRDDFHFAANRARRFAALAGQPKPAPAIRRARRPKTAAAGNIPGNKPGGLAWGGKERWSPCRTASRSSWFPIAADCLPGPCLERAWPCSSCTAWARS